MIRPDYAPPYTSRREWPAWLQALALWLVCVLAMVAW
jgi:hypothetical protein